MALTQGGIETMTPRQRVLNALAGKPVDRTPVANPTNVSTVELMDLADTQMRTQLASRALHGHFNKMRISITGRTG